MINIPYYLLLSVISGLSTNGGLLIKGAKTLTASVQAEHPDRTLYC